MTVSDTVEHILNTEVSNRKLLSGPGVRRTRVFTIADANGDDGKLTITDRIVTSGGETELGYSLFEPTPDGPHPVGIGMESGVAHCDSGAVAAKRSAKGDCVVLPSRTTDKQPWGPQPSDNPVGTGPARWGGSR